MGTRADGERKGEVDGASAALHEAMRRVLEEGEKLPPVSEMSNEERERERAFHRERLRALNASPRSDWHREFERNLRDDARPYGDDVQIRSEEELGIDPPRVDYLILDDKKLLMRGRDIYRIFRQHNIVEYKNPHDSLNMNIMDKIIGYAHLYIGLAKRMGERPREQVTLTIYRHYKNEELFGRMLADGTLTATDVPGVYHVKNLTDLPFQIVIGSELEGAKNAKFKALTDDAEEADVRAVIEEARNAVDPVERENHAKRIEFIGKKNPELVSRIVEGDRAMENVLMDILKPRIEERDRKRDRERERANLYGYVQKGGMSIDFAAREAGISADQFRDEMMRHGYRVPEAV